MTRLGAFKGFFKVRDSLQTNSLLPPSSGEADSGTMGVSLRGVVNTLPYGIHVPGISGTLWQK